MVQPSWFESEWDWSDYKIFNKKYILIKMYSGLDMYKKSIYEKHTECKKVILNALKFVQVGKTYALLGNLLY